MRIFASQKSILEVNFVEDWVPFFELGANYVFKTMCRLMVFDNQQFGSDTSGEITLYGNDRVIGYDLFNPLSHPNVKFLDVDKTIPPVDDMAYVEIDVGSMSHFRSQRKELLVWTFDNMVNNGYILTNKKLALELRQDTKYNFDIINLNEFDIPELWKNVHQSRLNTKVIL